MMTSQQVTKKSKQSTKVLKITMIVLGIFFLLLGIMISQGFMLFCFVFAGMYFIFESNSDKEYEYILEDNILTINVIKAKRKKYTAHELRMEELEVVAPHEHEAVRMYKKGQGNDLPKFDYTSYDDNVEYYTMIILENGQKIKLLLDLNEEMLRQIKMKNPQKVMI